MADDKVTIRVPESAHEEAKARKQASNQTWAEYITDDSRGVPDSDSIAHEITAKLNIETDEAEERIEALRELVEDTQEQLETLNDESTNDSIMTQTEVRSACESAMREVLPERAFR